ncbi:helix-turn-helix transcriptional regulator [Burkholderia sp. MBR-1]|uniref:helix-turn-helix transcriptional regulator n=1 Tax=Burkholderia sp. MBR-1 TaxID=2732364 RepID=UPI0015EEA6A3|nr:autoinducer binding domain-containing protein [Burkholderia sp. MBR-1]QMI49737.1 hypothetical protein MBR110_30140 [Burkholderia sp. MBR-1]
MDGTTIGAVAKIKRLRDSDSEIDLHCRVHPIIRALGGQSYVFTMVQYGLDANAPPHYRYFADCAPEWIQIYTYRCWYAIDPFLEYARTNLTPSVGSRIELASNGQREMIATAARYGFKSSLVVPLHGTTQETLGLLHVGTDTEPERGGEELLEASALIYRLLATEMLDIRLRQLRQHAIEEFGLQPKDLTVLQMAYWNRTAAEIAATMDLSISTIHALNREISGKFSTKTLRQAVQIAFTRGLLT